MIVACVYVMAPLAAILILSLNVQNKGIEEAAQTATAGLVTLIPEGLVLLMSVTFAVAAVRLARKDTLIQQMSATESLAAVDTICVDKTGTLTDGELRLHGVEIAEGLDAAAAHAALGRFAASAGDRNRTLEVVAARFPGEAARVGGEVPFSSEWKWSGLRIGSTSYVLGAPDVLGEAGALTLPPASPACSSARPRPGGGSSPSASRASNCRRTQRRRRRRAWRRSRWSCWRRRCGPTRRRRWRRCARKKST